MLKINFDRGAPATLHKCREKVYNNLEFVSSHQQTEGDVTSLYMGGVLIGRKTMIDGVASYESHPWSFLFFK